MTFIRDSLWEYRRRLAATIAQQRLNNRHFTIVSNNCWGAEIYRELGLQYQTPFVGLAIFAPCYIKLIKDLPRYMGETLKFTNISRYSSGMMSDSKLLSYSHPIGILDDDIEIHFYHYKNSADAYEKWTRRCDRVDWNNDAKLFFKFCDHDYCSINIIEEFNDIFYKNKVFLLVVIFLILDLSYVFKECELLEHVVNDNSLYFQSKQYFDVIHWLNECISEQNWQFETLSKFKLT